jgi:hypothetical protein
MDVRALGHTPTGGWLVGQRVFFDDRDRFEPVGQDTGCEQARHASANYYRMVTDDGNRFSIISWNGCECHVSGPPSLI